MGPSNSSLGAGALRFTVTTPADSAALVAMTEAVGVFNAEEVECLGELLREFFTRGEVASGYRFLTAWMGEGPVAFVCYGPRPLTVGTFDLYWVVTAPSHARSGAARELVAAVAEDLRRRSARLLLAETSGKSEYEAAHRFYERCGFRLEATIRDFYRLGDDVRMYVLRLT